MRLLDLSVSLLSKQDYFERFCPFHPFVARLLENGLFAKRESVRDFKGKRS